VWPTEPAKAGWSFNKWQKTRILKELPRHHLSNRLRNGPGPVAARAVVAAPADVVVVAAGDVEGPVLVAGAELPVDKAAAARAVKAADAAARAAVDVAKARVVTVTAAAAMVEASSSRT
jgi:hypothetical protein